MKDILNRRVKKLPYWKKGAYVGLLTGIISGIMLVFTSSTGSLIHKIFWYTIYYPFVFVLVFLTGWIDSIPCRVEFCFERSLLALVFTIVVGLVIYALIGMTITIMINKFKFKSR